MVDITWDIEGTGLLNSETIDYKSSPYKLKDNFKFHSIVVEDHETGELTAFYDGPEYVFDGQEYSEVVGDQTYVLKDYEPISYTRRVLSDFPEFVKTTSLNKIVCHNQINFDLLACKLYYGMDYEVEPDLWCGNKVIFEDTLVISKALNPDRLGGHSLDALSEKTGIRKIAFRKHLGTDVRFKHFAADMLYYNIYDVKANTQVYKMLEVEKGDWDWSDAISLEKSVAEIITRQEHRGFDFKTERAIELVRDLDIKLEALRSEVEPVLPPKPLAKTRMDFYTPSEKQFKKSGELNENIKKFVAKHEGTINEDNVATIFGKEYPLPMPAVPLVTEVPSTLKDTTHIKEWLVSKFGWNPSAWKERDLTCDAKKNRLSQEKFEAAVERYVEQTLASPFCKYRLEHLNLNKSNIKAKLLAKGCAKSFKVLTNPTLTVGQEKEICPGLIALESSFPHARKLADFLTYSHRRNSILGGGYDPEEDDDEHESGFMPNVREDGRIPTPADTCGAGTSRFKHRLVANIPRNSSLYGEEMRSLFGVGKGYVQLGYDFDSLEAKIESHYVYRYKGGPEYGISLTAEKPNDCHSVLARRITEILGREFPRNSAKSVKYGCSYNAQVARVAKIVGCDIPTAQIIFDEFWTLANPLKELKDRMQQYWETTGQKKFLIGIDKRKLPIRSKGNVINTAFQSAGVICAKRAMVIHDRKLKSEGMSVDFFKDDWKSKKYCQQMIAYHK
jgi:DNA polymerase I-like protein with 3'-5' exonuclease and polymerase domains